jgi:Flp pilus assembly protein TadG
VNIQRAGITRDRARGQVLVIFVLSFFALIGGTAFVVDGGNAMAQQRAAQNGADAASQAGTVVVAQFLMGGNSATGATGTCPTTPGDPWDLEVCKAVYGSAALNDVTIGSAVYVDYKGDPILDGTGAQMTVGGGVMPQTGTIAQGVRAGVSRQFGTYFARAIGLPSFTASTQATAVTGTVTTLCPAGSGCGLFPITVPTQVDTCDGSGKLQPGDLEWPYLGDADTTSDNEANVPICKNKNDDIGGGSAGSVGWLDYSTAIGVTTTGTCGNTFKDAVLSPCVSSLTFPTWVQTFAGGVGKGGKAIEDALNSYSGDTVQVPLFDGTCKVKPPTTALAACAAGDIGTGSNTWYHIPTFASFKLDAFFLNGNDKKQCGQLPGTPLGASNGADGCFKGWWVVGLTSPGAINLGPVTPNTSNQLGVQLIK